MESYSALLNLNFMTSLRTDNIIIDMLLAALIPIVSGALYQLVYTHWPAFLTHIGTSVLSSKNTSSISHEVSMNSPDLDENVVLREAVMQYVGSQVAPTYPNGSYKFKRIPASGSKASSNLADAIRNHYHIQTVPAMDAPVVINNNIALSIAEEECKVEKEHGEEKTIKRETVNLQCSASRFAREDAAFSFVSNGLEWYKQKVALASSQTRYLYQPLDSSKKEEKSLMSCQRYPLSGDKTFNTLFFDGKDKLLSLLENFDKKQGKFSIPGFPHKLVLLLHGPPGTGKTSLVKAIAAHTNRNIIAISLSRIQTNRQLISYMFDPTCSIEKEKTNSYRRTKSEKLKPEKVVYMLEDIDAASKIVIRKNEAPDASSDSPALPESIGKGKLASEMDDKVSISGLLDALKGILDSPRRIIVMTTNHVEKLDPALIRPGVVTLKIHMGTFSPDCALDMVRHYFGDVKKETEDQIVELINGLHEKKERGYSPAEVEQLCAENDTVEELLAALKYGSRVDTF